MSSAEPIKAPQSIPSIYSGTHFEKIESGFNAAIIDLDATLHADLKWSAPLKKAELLKEKGYKIVWSLDFGLFKNLPLPLSDTAQYRSLNIALDHFFETVYKPFSEQTIGVIIFKGGLDLSRQWPFLPDQVANLRSWLTKHFQSPIVLSNHLNVSRKNIFEFKPADFTQNEFGKNLLRHYCKDVAIDYFSMLCTRFEIDLMPYVLLDASSLNSKTHVFQLLDHEDFDLMQLAIKNAPYISFHALGWDDKAFVNGFIGSKLKSYKPEPLSPQVGLVVPQNPIFDPLLLKEYDDLIDTIEAKKNLKLISERQITVEWQGLDYLVTLDLGPSSLRMLEGFVAAGGHVVIKGKSLGLELEIKLEKFLKMLESQ